MFWNLQKCNINTLKTLLKEIKDIYIKGKKAPMVTDQKT